MVNFVQPGLIMIYRNSGSAIASGDIVVVGERIGVAMVDIAATTGSGSLSMEGVYSCPAATSQAWTQGQRLFYSAGDEELTTVATGNTPAGYAFEAKSENATTGLCKINEARPKQMPVQADSVAGDTAAMVTDFNLLLGKLKAAGMMANS